MMTVELFDMNMNPITLPGVTWLQFTARPIEAEPITEHLQNREVELGTFRKGRLIDARVMYKSYDYLDYKLLRNKLYKLFSPVPFVWAVDSEVPGIMWKVKVESYDPERINGTVGLASIVFKSSVTYARSIGTSMDEFTYDSDLWAYGLGLQMDASTQDYTHSASSFMIYNPSDVPVNPREDELVIRLKSISASGSDIRLTNTANGDEWRYQGVFQAGDTITIDGILTKRNGLNAVGETGPLFGLISLIEGNNDFTLTGLTGGFEITFEFPFLYV